MKIYTLYAIKSQILKEDQKLNYNNPISPPGKGRGELEITRFNRTRMTRIIRIFTDNVIRAYPSNPCNPCSFLPDLGHMNPYGWRAAGAG
jgi:hypothetical protein